MINVLFVFLLSSICSGTCAFDGDTTWCTPASEPSAALSGITLPEQFQATVESNYRNSKENYTSEFDEYYDYKNNRGLIIQYVSYEEVRQYFLYDTNEMITVITDLNKCYVQPLNTSSTGTPFGYEDVKKDGKGHIFSPINALKLEYNQESIGKDIIRGISVERFKSCAYLSELNSTVRIFWSFSDPLFWNSTNYIGNAMPIEMRLEGKRNDGEEWSIQYEYIKFRPFLTVKSEIFETPVGIFCPGRAHTTALPSIPDHFSFRIEATSTDLKLTTNQAEWYDDENKLVRIDSQTLTDEDIAAFGKTSLTEIHDFRRGIRFIIDRKNERCLNYTTLDPEAIDADYSNNTKYVKLRSVLELFNLKNNTFNYQYHGTKLVRDIECDVWIALRENWPPHPTINRISTWEWYFMRKNWTANNHGAMLKSIPVKLILSHYNKEPNSDLIITNTIVYNYYDYTEEKPDIFSFDLHACFSDLQTKNLMFTFDVPYSKSVQNTRDFKYRIADAIAKKAYLLLTRISNVDVQERDNQTIVFFKMLDKTPVIGNVENPYKDISLEDAFQLLNLAINKGDLVVQVNQQVFRVNNGSLREFDNIAINQDVKPNSENIETHTAIYISAGAAVGGIVFGSILTIIIVNLIRKRDNEGPILSMSGLLNPNVRD